MSCCGRNRSAPTVAHSDYSQPAMQAGPNAPASTIDFEYKGQTALQVTGPVTGRSYRFDKPGARIAVSRHDAASLLHIPNLAPVLGR